MYLLSALETIYTYNMVCLFVVPKKFHHNYAFTKGIATVPTQIMKFDDESWPGVSRTLP